MKTTAIHAISALRPLAAAAACALCASPALATNGMDMEGYGPISTGMGGVSQAIEHGTAAVIQNPATLALMPEGQRLDLAIGILGPRVSSSMAGMPEAKSGGTAYTMPAIGYAYKKGPLTYGIAVFSQGGMGTEYGANTFMAAGSGQPVRSELGVGRAILPIAWQVSPNFALGGTLDLMWGGLDMRMAASGAQLGSMVTGASGNLGMALPALGGAPWARIDFSNGSRFSGAATAFGWATKWGAVWKPTPEWTLGASYAFKTHLNDMKTSATRATLSAPGFLDTGRITVQDFQWPATLAVGAAWQATPKLLLAADVKRIQWSKVMKNFRLRYDSAGMGGSVSFALPQNWKDQTVYSLGAAYDVTPEFTLRGGINHASNPIPDAYVNPLFPATVKTHYTAGFGWKVARNSEINAAVTVAPKVTVTNGSGIAVSHRQTNGQLMFTQRF